MRIIAGTARSRRIEAPDGKNTRPTLDRVRENLFNMLQTRIHGARVLDLFAGSGALSLEALSRGASYAVMNDRDGNANRVELKNAETLGFSDRTRVLKGDWEQTAALLRGEGERFDLIFLDPPYTMTDLRPVMEALRPLADAETLVIAEHEAKTVLTVPDGMEQTNTRNWGFCGVSFYRFSEEEHT